jgi:hypothetical protein
VPREAGILEHTQTSAVRDAIIQTGAVRDAFITDTTITKRRKQVLLDIYSWLRQQNETARDKPATA